MIEKYDSGPAHLDRTADDSEALRLSGHVWIRPGTKQLVWKGPPVRLPSPSTLAQRRQRIQEAFTDSVIDEMANYHWREA